jgi:hypothetical protein
MDRSIIHDKVVSLHFWILVLLTLGSLFCLNCIDDHVLIIKIVLDLSNIFLDRNNKIKARFKVTLLLNEMCEGTM